MFGSFGKQRGKPNLRVGIPRGNSKSAQKSPKNIAALGSSLAARVKARALSQANTPAAKRKINSSSTSAQLSPTEVTKCLCLRLTQVPPKYNTKEFLTRHFKVYGNLTKVAPRSKQGYAIVEFDNHESARKAKLGGSILRPGTTPVKIAWMTPSASNLKAELMTPSVPKARAKESPMKPSFSFSMMVPQTADPAPITEEVRPKLSQQAVAQQLRQLMGQKYATPFDKYKVLEERDKILRKGRVKMSDVNRASSLKGTCTDMCPEKERYEREVQKRLSAFELRPDGTVDHAVAVKDYSRSSADQDEPLPHELRPGPILSTTMEYLMGQVAFECPEKETHIPAWYDFLWNRTRGIRKDITQQMMTDQLAVELVEKCARFHIYSAHRLCEMDIGDFDQKMNTENLAKCLQTLRHFYEDLGKAGVECWNEAEFRAYDVLLNLNDSNILRQVLSYKPSVRQSQQVRLAVKLFTIIQNNNYTGFFRQVHGKADYLQSCIAHRYFTEVRVLALKIMCRAYQANSQFPVSDLVDTLGFETDLAAVEFCQSYGLTISVDSGSTVILNKIALTNPKNPVPPKISYRLIESKRANMALGEILNGGLPVSSVVLPEPAMSFDSEGSYLYDPVILPYLEVSSEEWKAQEETNRQKIDLQIRQRRIQQNVENTAGTLAMKLLEETIQEPIGFAAAEVIFDFRSEHVLDKLIQPIIREVASTAKKEETEKMEMLVKQKRRSAVLSMLNSLSEKQTDLLISRNCVDMVRETAEVELRLAKGERKRREIDSAAQRIGVRFVNETVNGLIAEIGETVYREEVAEKLNRLRQVKLRLQKLSLRTTFNHWRTLTEKSRKKREILESFPSGPSTAGLSAAVEGLRPLKRARLSLPGEREAISKKLEESGDSMDKWILNSWQWTVEKELGRNSVEKLDLIRRNLQRFFLRRFFVRWRLQTREKRLSREFLSDFPCAPSCDSAGTGLRMRGRKRRVLFPDESLEISAGIESWVEAMEISRREQSFLEEESLIEDVREKENDEISIDFDSVDGIAGFVSPRKNKGPREERWRSEEVEKKERRSWIVEGSDAVEGLLAELNSELRNETRRLKEDELRWKAMIEES